MNEEFKELRGALEAFEAAPDYSSERARKYLAFQGECSGFVIRALLTQADEAAAKFERAQAESLQIMRDLIAERDAKADEAANLREDAERWRFLMRTTQSKDTALDLSVQPSGYNGGDHVWIEFGFKHPKWTNFTKEDVDAAVDAARAAIGAKP